MSIDTTTLQIIGVVGTWVASIGTVGAVITSLYLSSRDSRINLHVGAGERIVVGGGNEKPPRYCSIYIVNKGFRKATITNIGWRVGFLKKQYIIQQIDGNMYSSPLPIELDDGQEAKYMIPYLNHTGQHHWIDEFPKGFLDKHPRWFVRSIRLLVFTSIGKTFEAKLEKGLQEAMVASAEKHLTNQASGTQ